MKSRKKLIYLLLTTVLAAWPVLTQARVNIYQPRMISFRSLALASKNDINLWDLGIMQLAAHDLFNVDRQAELDAENGRLDLSTLLDHGTENILLGGEIRNRENIAIFSVARFFGRRYLTIRENGLSEKMARHTVVDSYHDQLDLSFRKLFNQPLPQPRAGAVNMTENLALRTLHDILPSQVVVEGQEKFILDHELFGQHLSVSQLKAQLSAPLDGVFEPDFRQMIVPLPGREDMIIDLQERDSSFAQQFNTEFTFEYFLAELEDGRYDSNDEVTKQINSLFAKGLYTEEKINGQTKNMISMFSRLMKFMPAN
jgi:hypothetical protein